MEATHKQDRKLIPGIVYFIFAPIGEGLVKIGTTLNPATKLQAFRGSQVSIDFELIGTIPMPTWNKAVAVEQRVRQELAVKRDGRTPWFKLTLLEAQRLVQLVQADVDRRAAAGLKRLDPVTRIAQEAAWHAAGIRAYRDGISFKDWPRVGLKYLSTWYRAKRAWQEGWNEASQQSVNTT
jgi:hypothetical protein